MHLGQASLSDPDHAAAMAYDWLRVCHFGLFVCWVGWATRFIRCRWWSWDDHFCKVGGMSWRTCVKSTFRPHSASPSLVDTAEGYVHSALGDENYARTQQADKQQVTHSWDISF
jgi:hypothetical protein